MSRICTHEQFAQTAYIGRTMTDPDSMLRMIEGTRGARLEQGLLAAELAGIEAKFGFRFPPDLADLLRTVLPTGERWPRWRAAMQGDDSALEQIYGMLDWPREGMCFDVQHGGSWDPSWGHALR